jgi:hypothetical protein
MHIKTTTGHIHMSMTLTLDLWIMALGESVQQMEGVLAKTHLENIFVQAI